MTEPEHLVLAARHGMAVPLNLFMTVSWDADGGIPATAFNCGRKRRWLCFPHTRRIYSRSAEASRHRPIRESRHVPYQAE
ncbi:hypothetical protein [Saccharopolyspora pogona]|uniref:hypothetical protein n=1 Tax=Saccharopolyspora pogona TaxID=333966 RepID=UPI00168908A4|nr:hypothetical protein [Saccharopolyspora pogona]